MNAGDSGNIDSGGSSGARATQLLEEFRSEARKLLKCANKKLDEGQQLRLKSWWSALQQQPGGAILADPPTSVHELLGVGIWQVDYARGKINWTKLWRPCTNAERAWSPWSSARPSEARSRMQVPLGRGTIGYIVRNASAWTEGIYIVDDTEADLRGAVAIEDRFVGQVNVLLYPFPFGLGEDVQIVPTLFLPVPRVFDQEYARSLLPHARSFGDQLLRLLDRLRYDHLYERLLTGHRPSEPHLFVEAEGSDGTSLVRAEVLRLAKAVSGGSQQDYGGETGFNVAPGFPWVGVVDTGPRQKPLHKRVLVQSYVEPEAFMLSKQLRAMKRCLTSGGFSGKERAQLGGRTAHVEPCPWSDDVIDVVLPLVDRGATLRGMLRFHMTRPIPENESSIRDVVEAARAAFGAHLDQVATSLGVLRARLSHTPVSLKIARDLEQTLFESLFSRAFRSSDEQPSEGLDEVGFGSIVRMGLSTIVPGEPKFSNEGDEEKLVPGLGEHFEELRRELHALYARRVDLRDSCIGASYWSWDRELVWERSPSGDTGAPATDIFDHRFLDIQRAVTLLYEGYGGGRDFTVRWLDDAQYTGRLRLDDNAAERMGSQDCYFHMGIATVHGGWYRELRVRHTPEKRVETVFVCEGDEDGSSSIKLQWVPNSESPMVRAWHVLPDQLKRHLASCRAGKRPKIAEVCASLTPIWSHHDGVTTPAPSAPLSSRGSDRASRVTKDEPVSKLLEAAAGDEFESLELQLFPVQILEHVYYWLAVGIRPHGHQRILSLASANIIRALEVEVRRMSNEFERAFFQGLFFLDDLVRRDYKHHLLQRIESINELVSNPKGTLENRHKKISQHTQRILAWFNVIVHTKGLYEPAHLPMADLLRSACGLAVHHMQDENRAHALKVCGDIHAALFDSGALKGVALNLPSHKRHWILALLADVIANAAQHSPAPHNPSVSWDVKRCVLSVRNHVTHDTGKWKALRDAARVINRCLELDAHAVIAHDESKLGVLNIVQNARRLRLGVVYTLTSQAGFNSIRVDLFLRRFLLDRRSGNEVT